jgi:hypothetical protein
VLLRLELDEKWRAFNIFRIFYVFNQFLSSDTIVHHPSPKFELGYAIHPSEGGNFAKFVHPSVVNFEHFRIRPQSGYSRVLLLRGYLTSQVIEPFCKDLMDCLSRGTRSSISKSSLRSQLRLAIERIESGLQTELVIRHLITALNLSFGGHFHKTEHL